MGGFAVDKASRKAARMVHLRRGEKSAAKKAANRAARRTAKIAVAKGEEVAPRYFLTSRDLW